MHLKPHFGIVLTKRKNKNMQNQRLNFVRNFIGKQKGKPSLLKRKS